MTAVAQILGGPDGIELVFIPELVAQLWRTVFFVAGLLLIARLWIDAVRPGLPGSVRWGALALTVFIGRALIVQAERWYAPVTVEGLPLLTAALACAWIAAARVGAGQAPR